MSISFIVAGALAALIIIAVAKSVRIVPHAELHVIERLGRYHRTLSGGLNFIVPFVDQTRAKFSTQEQMIDIPKQSVITKDNVSITIDGVVFLRVNNAQQATYEIRNLQAAVAQLAQTTLRAEIGKMDLDETLSSREEMNQALLGALDSASGGWGAKVTRVEISDISVPEGVQKAMELQLQAARERRAIETRAEAEKNATIAQAQGDRERAFLEAEAIERTAEARKKEEILMAEGQREAIALIAQGLAENPMAGEFLLAKDRIEAWNGIAASSSQNKVVVPFEASELLGGLSLLKEIAGKAAKN